MNELAILRKFYKAAKEANYKAKTIRDFVNSIYEAMDAATASLDALQEPGVSPREALADYAHAAWSGWMEYMFRKAIQNKDGSATIPAELVARWQRQMNTPYEVLPETEKESDRKEADKMLEIVSYPERK